MKIQTLSAVCFILIQSSLSEPAGPCEPDACQAEEGCRCSLAQNPIDDSVDPAPQLIAITFNEAIEQINYDNYWSKLFFNRTNPDGKPIGVTFFIPHENTDYTLVQDLYVRGYEIGDYSVTANNTKEYWDNISYDDLIEEFQGLRNITATFANIPLDDIIGVRTPQLELKGNLSIKAYIDSGLFYDNTWPTLPNELMLPYTLDYATTQRCYSQEPDQCPTDSYPGFWMVPITDINDINDVQCNVIGACTAPNEIGEFVDWLYSEVDAVRKFNRAPITLTLTSAWFAADRNNINFFSSFLDKLKSEEDIFLVTVSEIIKWMENPVPASQYTRPQYSREADCFHLNCRIENPHYYNDLVNMGSCAPCPLYYPWKGDPWGLGE